MDAAVGRGGLPALQVGASYGDAFLAGIGAGWFRNTAEAGRWARPGQTVRPDPARVAVYEKGYRLYRELYETNRELMKKAAVISRQG